MKKMTGFLVRCLSILLLGTNAFAAISVNLSETSPQSPAKLNLFEPLYVHIQYNSPQALRFQAMGVLQAAPQHKNLRMNPSPVYPAGRGEAIAWISYGQPITIDTLIVNVYNQNWQLLEQKSIPLSLQWQKQISDTVSTPPPWVTKLNREQQSAVGGKPQPTSLFWEILIRVFFLSIPIYWYLQIRVLYKWSGRWQKIACIPLIISIPLLLYTLFALSQGSNLWPVMMLFLTPLLLILLLSIIAFKKLSE